MPTPTDIRIGCVVPFLGTWVWILQLVLLLYILHPFAFCSWQISWALLIWISSHKYVNVLWLNADKVRSWTEKISPLPIQTFSRALIFFCYLFFKHFKISTFQKIKKIEPWRKAKKITKWGRKPPLAPELVPASSVQCSHRRLPFWSRIEPRCYYSTGCYLHLSNSFSFETPFFSSVTSLLLLCELHAVVFFFMH